MPALTEAELDSAYTRLCRVLTAQGEAQAPLLLARFALLAMLHIDDARAIERLIDEAADVDTDARPPG
jgi:hypothetical protein